MAHIYSRFYQFKDDPFSLTPDPKYFYPNALYQEAFMGMLYGITQRRGIMTLVGEAGVGKTTMLCRVRENISPSTRVIFLLNPHVPFEEILECLLRELALPVQSGKKLLMLEQLRALLLEEAQRKHNVALFLDEAQSIDPETMEDIRLLSNLETPKTKLLQIVFAGQPEFQEKLQDPSLRQLRQRVAVRCRLYPLADDEVAQYIQTRLEIAGVRNPRLFSDGAIKEITRLSQGIPRLINLACDQALLTAYAQGKKRIDTEIIQEALADFTPPISTQSVEPAAPPPQETRKALAMSPPPQLPEQKVAIDSAPQTPPEEPQWPQWGQEDSSRPLTSFPHTIAFRVALMMTLGAAGAIASGWVISWFQAGLIGREAEVSPANTAPLLALPQKGKSENKAQAPERENNPILRIAEARTPLPVDKETPLTSLPPQTSRSPSAVQMITQSGDTLTTIALEKYGYVTYTMLDLLRVANPAIADIDFISSGQTITLPDLNGVIRIFAEIDGSYSYHLLSTRSEKRASDYQKRFTREGYTLKLVPTPAGRSKTLYRLFVSGFPSSQEAATTGGALEQSVQHEFLVSARG